MIHFQLVSLGGVKFDEDVYEVLLPTAKPGASGYLQIAALLFGRIRRERPDALLSTVGGQTGLNLAIDLAEAGILETRR